MFTLTYVYLYLWYELTVLSKFTYIRISLDRSVGSKDALWTKLIIHPNHNESDAPIYEFIHSKIIFASFNQEYVRIEPKINIILPEFHVGPLNSCYKKLGPVINNFRATFSNSLINREEKSRSRRSRAPFYEGCLFLDQVILILRNFEDVINDFDLEDLRLTRIHVISDIHLCVIFLVWCTFVNINRVLPSAGFVIHR